LPGIDIFGIFIEKQQDKSKIDMHNLLSEFLPSRLAKIWCTSNIQSKPVNQYNEKELKKIAIKYIIGKSNLIPPRISKR